MWGSPHNSQPNLHGGTFRGWASAGVGGPPEWYRRLGPRRGDGRGHSRRLWPDEPLTPVQAPQPWRPAPRPLRSRPAVQRPVLTCHSVPTGSARPGGRVRAGASGRGSCFVDVECRFPLRGHQAWAPIVWTPGISSRFVDPERGLPFRGRAVAAADGPPAALLAVGAPGAGALKAPAVSPGQGPPRLCLRHCDDRRSPGRGPAGVGPCTWPGALQGARPRGEKAPLPLGGWCEAQPPLPSGEPPALFSEKSSWSFLLRVSCPGARPAQGPAGVSEGLCAQMGVFSGAAAPEPSQHALRVAHLASRWWPTPAPSSASALVLRPQHLTRCSRCSAGHGAGGRSFLCVSGAASPVLAGLPFLRVPDSHLLLVACPALTCGSFKRL